MSMKAWPMYPLAARARRLVFGEVPDIHNMYIQMGSFWIHFGVILGSIWGHLEIILKQFCDPVGTILGSFWDHFGVPKSMFSGTSFLASLVVFFLLYRFGSILGLESAFFGPFLSAFVSR